MRKSRHTRLKWLAITLGRDLKKEGLAFASALGRELAEFGKQIATEIFHGPSAPARRQAYRSGPRAYTPYPYRREYGYRRRYASPR